MGTPDFAVPTLRALHASGHEIAACYTRAPKPSGRRGLALVRSPVHEAADELGIDVFSPASFECAQERERFASLKCDIAVAVAYGLILPQEILDAPLHGCFNGHASLLPRGRGAAPIARAIMEGDETSGISIMKMEKELDTGPCALTQSIRLTSSMTAGCAHDRLADLCAELMTQTLAKLEKGALTLTPQDSRGVCYAAKISKSETRIDWTRPAERVHRHIMALSPAPAAWCLLDDSAQTRLKILESEPVDDCRRESGAVCGDSGDFVIACGQGGIKALHVQKAGGKRMSGEEFLRGNGRTGRVL